jgi:hypothetical protein
VKGAGKMAQVVECLLIKHEALSSNPSTSKKKKNEIGLRKIRINSIQKYE